jgi:outer membrane immunogenic protein
MKNSLLYPVAALIVVSSCVPAFADSTTDAILRRMEAKIDALAKDNATLRTKLSRMEGTRVASVAPASRTVTDASPPSQLPKNVYAASYPVKAAPVMPAHVYSWTGHYIGANAGGHWSSDKNSDSFSAPGFSSGNVVAINAVLPTDLSSSGFAGGVHAGYNWQVSNFVLGVEADFNWLSGSGSNTSATGGLPATAAACAPLSCWMLTDRAKDNWLSTVRARTGFAVNNFLIYGTGGVAFSNWSINHTFTDTSFGYSYAPVSQSITRTGWTVGAGVEYALTRNWIIRGEYLFADFGTVTNTIVSTGGGFGATTLVYQDRLKESIARGGISYKF